MACESDETPCAWCGRDLDSGSVVVNGQWVCGPCWASDTASRPITAHTPPTKKESPLWARAALLDGIDAIDANTPWDGHPDVYYMAGEIKGTILLGPDTTTQGHSGANTTAGEESF